MKKRVENMKKLLKYMVFAYPALILCFLVGYSVSEMNRKYEISKNNRLVITGKIEIFVKNDMYSRENPVLATVDKGDEVKILDFYFYYDFGGIEVELADGRRGYIQYFNSQPNYEIIRGGQRIY